MSPMTNDHRLQTLLLPLIKTFMHLNALVPSASPLYTFILFYFILFCFVLISTQANKPFPSSPSAGYLRPRLVHRPPSLECYVCTGRAVVHMNVQKSSSRP
ncbi:hypothetical protein LY78DRAFT_196630 [Colletotrichum sublineola]|nr:hypothetical protein LY78DRAFT_196630 [Colletotrichum sublineola]